MTYTHLNWLFASPTEPMPQASRTHQLTRMWQGLAALESAPEPSTDDWRVCSDAVNLMETMIRDMRICEDSDGLLMDAITALAMAGQRHTEGKPLRLDGAGIKAVRSVLEDYADVLDQISHRTAIDAHRRTEKRWMEIMRGKKQPHDVVVKRRKK